MPISDYRFVQKPKEFVLNIPHNSKEFAKRNQKFLLLIGASLVAGFVGSYIWLVNFLGHVGLGVAAARSLNPDNAWSKITEVTDEIVDPVENKKMHLLTIGASVAAWMFFPQYAATILSLGAAAFATKLWYNITQSGPKLDQALREAARKSDLNRVDLLLEAGANPYTLDAKTGNNAFHEAVQSNQNAPKVLKKLRSFKDMEKGIDSIMTSEWNAVREHNHSILENLNKIWKATPFKSDKWNQSLFKASKKLAVAMGRFFLSIIAVPSEVFARTFTLYFLRNKAQVGYNVRNKAGSTPGELVVHYSGTLYERNNMLKYVRANNLELESPSCKKDSEKAKEKGKKYTPAQDAARAKAKLAAAAAKKAAKPEQSKKKKARVAAAAA